MKQEGNTEETVLTSHHVEEGNEEEDWGALRGGSKYQLIIFEGT